jgi:hypothetical protein
MRTFLATTSLLAILSYVLAIAPFAWADPNDDPNCGPDGNIALGVVEIDTPAGTFYVDDRNYLLGNGIWLYQECNGIDGLQRGGSSPILPDDNEICQDDPSVPPDCFIL